MAETLDKQKINKKVADIDWAAFESELTTRGYGNVTALLDTDQCQELVTAYADDAAFRKTISMARHNFGRGEYRYFDYPLPPLVDDLRAAFYPALARIANTWQLALGEPAHYPATLEAFTRRCHEAGQARPTPLLLRYGVDDYNCLHQDLYGEVVFPLQLAVVLSQPGVDFDGGEFVITEQRPRMQSRAEVVPLNRGDAVIFPVQVRPVRGSRGYYRVNMRHGVSRLRRGSRTTLGIIFHDAR